MRQTAACGVIALFTATAGAAAAQTPGEFVIFRDVPVHNAITPNPPGAYTAVQMSPDMSVMNRVFGSAGSGITSITDQAAAEITSSTVGDNSKSAAANTSSDTVVAEQFQLAGASMEARGGLGGSIAGAVQNGLAPLMGLSKMMGGAQ